MGLFYKRRSSIPAGLIGFLFVFISSIGLWFNEGRSVNQSDALHEMQAEIQTLPDTKYHPDFQNKPVLVQGKMSATATVIDPEFKISTKGLVLKRTVEMYQWEEITQSEPRNETSYHYKKKWLAEPMDSSSFKESETHYNPPFPYPNESFTNTIMIGDYRLSKEVLDKIEISRNLSLSSFPNKINDAINHKSFLFIGKDVNIPSIGDVKISYQYAPEGDYSIAAKLENKSLFNYTSSNKKSLSFVRNGIVSATRIFDDEQANNTSLTWTFRVFGLIIMFLSFWTVLRTFTAFLDYIPVIGPLLNGVSSVVAGVLTLIFGSLVISLAWFSARPLLAVSILTIGGIIAFLLGKFGKKRKNLKAQQRASTSTPPPRKTPPPRT